MVCCSLPDDNGGEGGCDAEDPDKDRQEHAKELKVGMALPDRAKRLWRRHISKSCCVGERESKVVDGLLHGEWERGEQK